ncbi:autotransporter strand-loop-strand O-heptosyltransferase [Acetobacteraceae bacterium]|nr:autotransporter strand-loop-strand O-heptosyltransferase [Acetobacteraceae bacterium]
MTSSVASDQKISVAPSPQEDRSALKNVLHNIQTLAPAAPAGSEDKKPAPVVEKKVNEDAFPPPSKALTQEGEQGIRYDFNIGARIYVPAGKWIIRVRDLDTASILHEFRAGDVTFVARKKYWMNLRLEAVNEETGFSWSHSWNGKGKKIAIVLPGGTLGDSIAWFTYAARFALVHDCKLTVIVAEHIRELFATRYKHITFMVRDEFSDDIRKEMYATYYMGLYFRDETNEFQPDDFRMLGLHRTAGALLGVDLTEEAPVPVVAEPDAPPIPDPYVVIAVQGSSACKLWNNPTGWHAVVDYLKQLGYRVICIDKEPVTGHGIHWNHLPNGVEDETGNRPLAERARWIKYADFFIGLSSGLSWLAWTVNAKIIMISGFTHPRNEFYTPWRIFSANGCNSCWHDVRVPFEHSNYLFCPRHKETQRQFECTRIITSEYVIQTIDRLMKESHLIAPKDRKVKKVKTKK